MLLAYQQLLLPRNKPRQQPERLALFAGRRGKDRDYLWCSHVVDDQPACILASSHQLASSHLLRLCTSLRLHTSLHLLICCIFAPACVFTPACIFSSAASSHLLHPCTSLRLLICCVFTPAASSHRRSGEHILSNTLRLRGVREGERQASSLSTLGVQGRQAALPARRAGFLGRGTVSEPHPGDETDSLPAPPA